MARMSIDDSAPRDPRVKKLARAMGWHRHQALGALIDVWAVCYDRVTAVLTVEDVDLAVEIDGFCARMVECDLARTLPGDANSVHIAGVEKRIGYLNSASESGKKGGVKSGESRRRKREATLRKPSSDPSEGSEGSTNPSALVPDSASAPVLPSAVAPVPEGSTPSPKREAADRAPGVATTAKALVDALWDAHQAARSDVAAKLGVSVLPLSWNDPGRRELAERLREERSAGASAAEAEERCRRAIARAAADFISGRSSVAGPARPALPQPAPLY